MSIEKVDNALKSTLKGHLRGADNGDFAWDVGAVTQPDGNRRIAIMIGYVDHLQQQAFLTRVISPSATGEYPDIDAEVGAWLDDIRHEEFSLNDDPVFQPTVEALSELVSIKGEVFFELDRRKHANDYQEYSADQILLPGEYRYYEQDGHIHLFVREHMGYHGVSGYSLMANHLDAEAIDALIKQKIDDITHVATSFAQVDSSHSLSLRFHAGLEAGEYSTIELDGRLFLGIKDREDIQDVRLYEVMLWPEVEKNIGNLIQAKLDALGIAEYAHREQLIIPGPSPVLAQPEEPAGATKEYDALHAPKKSPVIEIDVENYAELAAAHANGLIVDGKVVAPGVVLKGQGGDGPEANEENDYGGLTAEVLQRQQEAAFHADDIDHGSEDELSRDGLLLSDEEMLGTDVESLDGESHVDNEVNVYLTPEQASELAEREKNSTTLYESLAYSPSVPYMGVPVPTQEDIDFHLRSFINKVQDGNYEQQALSDINWAKAQALKESGFTTIYQVMYQSNMILSLLGGLIRATNDKSLETYDLNVLINVASQNIKQIEQDEEGEVLSREELELIRNIVSASGFKDYLSLLDWADQQVALCESLLSIGEEPPKDLGKLTIQAILATSADPNPKVALETHVEADAPVGSAEAPLYTGLTDPLYLKLLTNVEYEPLDIHDRAWIVQSLKGGGQAANMVIADLDDDVLQRSLIRSFEKDKRATSEDVYRLLKETKVVEYLRQLEFSLPAEPLDPGIRDSIEQMLDSQASKKVCDLDFAEQMALIRALRPRGSEGKYSTPFDHNWSLFECLQKLETGEQVALSKNSAKKFSEAVRLSPDTRMQDLEFSEQRKLLRAIMPKKGGDTLSTKVLDENHTLKQVLKTAIKMGTAPIKRAHLEGPKKPRSPILSRLKGLRLPKFKALRLPKIIARRRHPSAETFTDEIRDHDSLEEGSSSNASTLVESISYAQHSKPKSAVLFLKQREADAAPSPKKDDEGSQPDADC